MKWIQKTRTKKTISCRLRRKELCEALSIDPDTVTAVYVRIPGGGDYSNQDLDIGDTVDGSIHITIVETSESEASS